MSHQLAGSEVGAEFLFLYRNHVHKNNSPRSGRAVYYEVILMC